MDKVISREGEKFTSDTKWLIIELLFLKAGANSGFESPYGGFRIRSCRLAGLGKSDETKLCIRKHRGSTPPQPPQAHTADLEAQ